jgi:hypothetical protein
MVNQQLVDYIKQQIQGGVTKDAIKKALLDAGWPTADVEDSMKAADSTAAAQPAASSKIDTMAMMGGATAGAAVAASSPLQKSETKFFSEPGASIEQPAHGSRIAMIVMGALIVILLATLGYIYFSLNGKVSSINGTVAVTASEGEALRAQVTQLAADKDALTGQVNTLTEQNQVFAEEVAFAANTGTTTDVSVTLRGTVSGSTSAYFLTTAHGLKVAIKNSKDARVDAGLKPLVGQNAVLTGTHRPGVMDLTIATINGAELSTISTSTPPAATTTSPTPPAP